MAPDPYLTANTFCNNNSIENGRNKIFLSKIWMHDSLDIIPRLLCTRSLWLTVKVASHCQPWYYSHDRILTWVRGDVCLRTNASVFSLAASRRRTVASSHAIHLSLASMSSAYRSACVRCSAHFSYGRVTECLALRIPLALAKWSRSPLRASIWNKEQIVKMHEMYVSIV